MTNYAITHVEKLHKLTLIKPISFSNITLHILIEKTCPWVATYTNQKEGLKNSNFLIVRNC